MVLPYINMNLPQIYTCYPSWTLLPPPSPYHPSGASQCTSPKHPVSCIEPGLVTRFICDIISPAVFKIFFLLLVFRFALAWHYLFFRLGFIEILESLSFQFSLNLENILPLFFSKIFYCSLIIDTLDILVLSHRSVKKLLIVSVPRAVNSMSFQWVSCLPLISTNTIFIQSFTWEPLYLPFNSSL